MKKKVVIGYVIIATILLLAFEYAFWSNGFSYLESQSEASYVTQAELMRDLLLAEDVIEQDSFEAFAERMSDTYDVRVTIIDKNGNVLGESQEASELMTNHLNREEVQLALQGEANSVIRRSETFAIDYCYCAVPVETDSFWGVIRVAVPMDELYDMDLEFLRSTLLAVAILLLIVISLGMYFRRYIRAMKNVENMRREFVSNVTHELKTPLTSIRGFVETLQEGAIEDPKMARKFLNIIDIETDRLTNLISDTLLLSEIENKKEPERELCDVNAVIQEVVELMQPRVKEHVRLIFNPDETVQPYSCNRDWFKQMIINLVDNGLKATEFGAVTITCKSSASQLVLEVADTGIGMEEEQLERIFERFYRVDKGRSKAMGGTGLGLSIVKHIVGLYQGTIDVTSKPGVGSEFTVKLPY